MLEDALYFVVTPGQVNSNANGIQADVSVLQKTLRNRPKKTLAMVVRGRQNACQLSSKICIHYRGIFLPSFEIKQPSCHLMVSIHDL